MIDHVRHLSLAVLFLCAAGCTALQSAREPAPARGSPVTLLVFGDTGYHYDYLEKEDYEAVVTEAQFLAKEREDWIEDKRPIEELDFPPMYKLPRNGSIIAASGQAPVATAMRSYCAKQGCDFATLLGDNIYPDGATAGADGIDDALRFRDLLTIPYGPLGDGHKDFRIYTVLGNHDWHTSREGAMAQVRFMETSPPFYMKGLISVGPMAEDPRGERRMPPVVQVSPPWAYVSLPDRRRRSRLSASRCTRGQLSMASS